MESRVHTNLLLIWLLLRLLEQRLWEEAQGGMTAATVPQPTWKPSALALVLFPLKAKHVEAVLTPYPGCRLLVAGRGCWQQLGNAT